MQANMSNSFSGQMSLPRGLRDNNPGNIMASGNHWLGQTSLEHNYVVFVDIEHGIRAMAKDLKTKIGKDGLNTIAKYIPKYCPDNTQASYIHAVSAATTFSPDEILTPDYYTLFKLVKAHIGVEVGQHYAPLVTDEMIKTGVTLALT